MPQPLIPVLEVRVGKRKAHVGAPLELIGRGRHALTPPVFCAPHAAACSLRPAGGPCRPCFTLWTKQRAGNGAHLLFSQLQPNKAAAARPSYPWMGRFGEGPP